MTDTASELPVVFLEIYPCVSLYFVKLVLRDLATVIEERNITGKLWHVTLRICNSEM